MDDDDTGAGGHQPATQLDGTAQRVRSLPAARPGESLRPYVRRIGPILTEWLDGTRRWRRRAQWEVIRAAVEGAYGDRVSMRTLETYLATARKAAAAPLPQIPSEPTPAPISPPTPPIRTSTGVRGDSPRMGANGARGFVAPRT